MAKEEVVRSREELDAKKYTEDFLKKNRPNLTGFEQRLATFGEHPGWVRRWAVDQHNRIEALLERGWRFVLRNEVGLSDSLGRGNTDIGSHVSTATFAGSGPVRQVLMETTQQLYDLQAEASMQRVRQTEEALQKGFFDVADMSNVYQPIPNKFETKLQ